MARSGGRSVRQNGHLIASGLMKFGAVWAGRARITGVRLIFFMPISAASQCEEERKGNQG